MRFAEINEARELRNRATESKEVHQVKSVWGAGVLIVSIAGAALIPWGWVFWLPIVCSGWYTFTHLGGMWLMDKEAAMWSETYYRLLREEDRYL